MQSIFKLNQLRAISNIKNGMIYTRMLSKYIQSWKSQVSKKEANDIITPSQINLMGNTLDHPKFNYDQIPSNGSEIPPGWHLAYFPPRIPEKKLSESGYDTDWTPPEPYTHRMWAGGKLDWNTSNPLRVGDKVRMEASLQDIDVKKDGHSAFVWADYNFYNDKGFSVSENRCWIYTDGHKSKEKGVGKVTEDSSTSHDVLSNPEFTFSVTPSPITLFRFSALTFNSHLIHYDNVYATEVEKQKGCLTHGPLSLIYLINQLDQHLAVKDADQSAGHNNSGNRRIKSLEYRCLNPLHVNEALTISGKTNNDSDQTYDLWITDNSGKIAVKAIAVIDRIK